MDATGRVIPCCAAPKAGADLVFDLLPETDARDAFNSPKYRLARTAFASQAYPAAREKSGLSSVPYCVTCEWNQETAHTDNAQVGQYLRTVPGSPFDAQSMGIYWAGRSLITVGAEHVDTAHAGLLQIDPASDCRGELRLHPPFLLPPNPRRLPRNARRRSRYRQGHFVKEIWIQSNVTVEPDCGKSLRRERRKWESDLPASGCLPEDRGRGGSYRA